MFKKAVSKPKGEFDLIVNGSVVHSTNFFSKQGFKEIFSPNAVWLFDKDDSDVVNSGVFKYCQLGNGSLLTSDSTGLSGDVVSQVLMVGNIVKLPAIDGNLKSRYEITLGYDFPNTIAGVFNQLALSPITDAGRLVCGNSFNDTTIALGDTVRVIYRVVVEFSVWYRYGAEGDVVNSKLLIPSNNTGGMGDVTATILDHYYNDGKSLVACNFRSTLTTGVPYTHVEYGITYETTLEEDWSVPFNKTTTIKIQGANVVTTVQRAYLNNLFTHVKVFDRIAPPGIVFSWSWQNKLEALSGSSRSYVTVAAFSKIALEFKIHEGWV